MDININSNINLGIQPSPKLPIFHGQQTPDNLTRLNAFWNLHKNDMAMGASKFPNGNQMKRFINRLKIIENRMRKIEAYFDNYYESNDYSYTDD